MPTNRQAAAVASAGLTVQDLAQLLAAPKKDRFAVWKLSQYNSDPRQWHGWFEQSKSAIDSASLTDDAKLKYLKTLVTGKAKTAIAEFVYCGTMYRVALRTLDWKPTIRCDKCPLRQIESNSFAENAQ